MISIIIPFYNEERMLTKVSPSLQKLSCVAELIFVDGQSTDQGAQIASQFGKIFQSKKNRASQMNYGASQARGDILLFLHADNFISPLTLDKITQKIGVEGYAGGCLTQRLDDNAFIYRLIESQGNLRARLTKEFYGDQGIFVKKAAFLALGGFPEVPIMEDVLFSRSLRKYGKTVVLPEKILVSARRWKEQGILKTALLFSLINVLFWLRVPLPEIKQLYSERK